MGPQTTATLGATSVKAYAVDSTSGGVTDYGLLYIDSSVTPNRLYLPGESGVNDGSTPQKRPTTLDSVGYLLKQ